MTLLCCPLLVTDVDRALADAAAARALGADLVEYRLDEIFTGGIGDADLEAEIATASRLVSESPVACIATCRPVWEGGAYDGPEDARIALFEALGTLAPPRGHAPRFIDVELAAYQRSANIRQKVHLAVDHPAQGRGRDLAPSLILSIHDFAGRPADLSRRLLAARASDACRVVKVAYQARSLRDNLELFDILSGRDRPTMALGMGEFGLLSRVLAPKFGAFATFASLRPTQTTAPGQPTIAEMLGLYRFRAIGPRTRVYGIAGWPVGHSLSPLLHNAGFEAAGWDGVYLPLPIASSTATARDEPEHVAAGPARPPAEIAAGSYASFKATMLALIDHEELDFSGCSVTSPHKENLVVLARERGWRIDPLAARCGAANTLIVHRDPGGGPNDCAILNTDAGAARSCLEAALGPLQGRRVGLIGAGGVARAIAAACADAGAHVTIHARNPGWARTVAGDLGRAPASGGAAAPVDPPGSVASAALADLDPTALDAVVNCTPVGMAGGPAPGESPIDPARLGATGRLVVFDTVYAPVETPLLRAARAAGCRTIDGLGMLLRQAGAQFFAWTGHPAPSGLFERIARESIGGCG